MRQACGTQANLAPLLLGFPCPNNILAACKRGPAKYKRVFSSVKKLIIPKRNRLTEEIIEVSKYLK
jgi:hypothetical protein